MLGWNLGQMGSSLETGMVSQEGDPASQSLHPAKKPGKQQENDKDKYRNEYNINERLVAQNHTCRYRIISKKVAEHLPQTLKKQDNYTFLENEQIPNKSCRVRL